MKLALLKGNRFNPWHLQVYNRMPELEVTAFRAESEVQSRFAARDDGSVELPIEPIYFDTQKGNPVSRAAHQLGERYGGRTPRVLPFHDRLQGYDIIQSWELFTDWTAEALEAKRLYGTPLALMVWDNIPFNNEGDDERRAYKKRALAEADVFLVHSERSRRMLEIEGADPARIRDVPPGVDTKLFAPGDQNRKQFGFRDDEFAILFVGWLLPRKGIDFLLLALRELLDDPELSERGCRLHVVGSGPGRERVDALIERLSLGGHISFTDSLPYGEMPEAYRAADVFVLPSIATETWQEQFGMSLLEAMACGTPVVSTHSGAIPEILGESGILCQPNDFLSLYSALRELALNEEWRNTLGEAGRERATAHFDLSRSAEALDAVYRELTGD